MYLTFQIMIIIIESGETNAEADADFMRAEPSNTENSTFQCCFCGQEFSCFEEEDEHVRKECPNVS